MPRDLAWNVLSRREQAVLGVIVVGVVIIAAPIVLTWALIAALILAVPFGLWWRHDQQRQQRDRAARQVPLGQP